MELKVCLLGAVRRRTFICCRNIQISTSSAVRDRNRSATIQTMSLTRSLIPQEHRPILDQLPVRLSLRQGQAPGFMIRDRDRIYGGIVTRRLRAMGIRDKPTAPVSPWQNGFAERLIGSMRRECLDHRFR